MKTCMFLILSLLVLSLSAQELSPIEQLGKAIFFDKIRWHYSYEINLEDEIKHNFLVRTNNSEEYLTYVMLRRDFTLKFRQKLGITTKYAKNVLILFDSPFPLDDFAYCKNLIGMSSVEGQTKNDKGEVDFEFCSAVVSNKLYEVGTNIYNLCILDPMFHNTIRKENSFCLELWKECKLIDQTCYRRVRSICKVVMHN